MGSGSRNLLLACGAAAVLSFVPARSVLHAQGTITGKVTAEGSGQPVAGAHVLILGTTTAAVAGEDGKYTLRNVKTGNNEVQVLNVGYKAQKKTVPVNNGSITEADFVLAVAVTQLTDVVVSATGEL